MRRKFMVVPALGAATLLALGACGSYTAIDLFEREQVAEDRLPDSIPVPEDQETELDPASARLAITHDGIEYYLAKDRNSQLGCIYAVAERDPDQFVGGCGGLGQRGEIVTITGTPPVGTTGAFTMVTDDSENKQLINDGWEQIHPNILVRDRRKH